MHPYLKGNRDLAEVIRKAAKNGESLSFETLMVVADRLDAIADPFKVRKQYKCHKCQDTGTVIDHDDYDTFSHRCDCQSTFEDDT